MGEPMIDRTSISLVAAVLLVAAVPTSPARADLMALVRRPAPATTTVLLLDRSQSISPADAALHQASIRNAGVSLRSGDRLLIAEIGDGGAGDFRPVLDIKVPKSDVRLDREAGERAARARIEQRLPALTATPAGKRPQTTRILETIAAAAPALKRGDGAEARLVIVSDAVEESAIANLARRPIGQAETEAALRKARSLGLLPNLNGVELSFAGAGGKHYGANQAFWAAYARQTGARLQDYGRLPYEGSGSGK